MFSHVFQFVISLCLTLKFGVLIGKNEKTKMKSFKYYLKNAFVAVLAVIGLSACSSDDDAPEPLLSVSSSRIDVEAGGGSEIFEVESNAKWNISGGTAWCRVSPQQGTGTNQVSIDVKENPSEDSRECTLRVTTADGSVMRTVDVHQDGAKTNLNVPATRLVFTSEKGNRKVLEIKCNLDWSISDIPSWLDADKTNGSGNGQVSFTTRSENSSATPRTAKLIVTSQSENIMVEVIQEAGASSCVVRPKTDVALGDEYACDWSYSSNVKYYMCGLYNKAVTDRMTDNEIIAYLESETRDTPKDNYVTSWTGLSPNTRYVLCVIAYDNDDKQGELVKHEFSTKQIQSLEALADIDYVIRTTDNRMVWQVTPSSKCSSYHMISGVDVSDNAISCMPVVYAWLISNYIENGKYGLYSNYTIDLNLLREEAFQKNIKAPLYAETNVFVATWGKFSDMDGGAYSSIITCEQGYFNVVSSSDKAMSVRKGAASRSNGMHKEIVDLSRFKNIVVK